MKTGAPALYARLAIAGVVLYVVLDIVAQALPPHYNPIRQAESDLAVGPYGWIMAINFVVRGLLSFALLVALVRSLPHSAGSRFGLALLGVWAAGSALLAAFPTDVASGVHTAHGRIHLLLALIAFVAVAAGEVLLSRSLTERLADFRGPATILAALMVLSLLLLFAPILNRDGGLKERLFLGLALLWILVVGWKLSSSKKKTAALPRESGG